MELTLAVPCQALLILDADFPVDLLPQVVQALSVTPASDSDGKHAETKRLEHITSLQVLYGELSKKEFLRGRFIVFPHVGEGGNCTLLRSGFAEKYKSMPCVGGYVDGAITQLGNGNRAILDGKNKDYGNKAVAVIQTSDNRNRNFSKLGANVTWIKWAAPTAEALRQACLARFSRITHDEPRLPTIRITGLEVSNSKFLGPINVDFNPQFNAIIGGRGTGKSSILEYIRWGLCDQPVTVSADSDEAIDFQRRRQSLVDGTLIPLDAVVDVSFLVNEVPHVIRRKASGEVTLKIGDAPFESCTQDDAREILPIRAYSQKQLSAVGAKLEELRRFVQSPVQKELDALEAQIAGTASEIRLEFERLVRHRALQLEIAAHDIERKSLGEQIDRLRGSLKGLSDADKATIELQSKYEAEERIVKTLQRDASTAADALAAAEREIEGLPVSVVSAGDTENAELLDTARNSLTEAMRSALEAIRKPRAYFNSPGTGTPTESYFGAISEWIKRKQVHQEKYEAAKSRSATHEQTLRQIQTLETNLAQLNSLIDTKSAQLAKLGDPTEAFGKLRQAWVALYSRRADILDEQCRKLSNLPKCRLRALLKRASDTTLAVDRLKQVAKGTKIRGERFEDLAALITSAESPPLTWSRILDELLQLAWLRVGDEATTALPPTELLDSIGFTSRDKIALARQLLPPAWLDLSLIELKDTPVFEYMVREDDFMQFEKASPGQQATALLTALLLQEGPPLLIDQPEDDLNMRIINDVVETLWEAKKRRQLLFVSHNANLVVNGDAECVVCCDYRTTATESGGRIKLAGAIDVPEINREIADVMEGGIEAFKLRYEKYRLPAIGLPQPAEA
jgi:chromosome segregation protein